MVLHMSPSVAWPQGKLPACLGNSPRASWQLALRSALFLGRGGVRGGRGGRLGGGAFGDAAAAWRGGFDAD